MKRMKRMEGKVAKMQKSGAKNLNERVKSQEQDLHSVGAVAKDASPFNERNKPLQPINLDLTSASGSNKTFLIGDPHGIVADAHGIETRNRPDSGSVDPAKFENALSTRPVAIVGINYKVSSDDSQFQEAFDYLTGDVDGFKDSQPINWSASERNNQNNSKLLTKEFDEAFPLDHTHALQIDVKDGEDVYLTLFPSAVKG